MTVKYLRSLTALLILFLSLKALAQQQGTAVLVPLGGNAFVSKNGTAKIGEKGLTNWSSAKDSITIYVWVERAGDLDLALKLKVPDGNSTIALSCGQTFLKPVTNKDTAIVNFGTVRIDKPGYVKITLQGKHRTGSTFADVSDLVLKGGALSDGAAYVKDNHGNYFYWGRRGPSVHLNYPLPDEAKKSAEWFYNEVTVQPGDDVIGSYFMAEGFTGGYFGMQVNSATERHVLFSIWSPFQTDDPKSIPDSLKIQMLKKGKDVHAGEFGSEGSGGQSYLNYMWQAGKTYCFLIHAEADSAAKTTTFTAYFKEKTQKDWMLIASFKRPKSGYYLQGLYSFLENFIPETGYITRKVSFGNQWLINTKGKWYPVNKAKFTGDATANINYRKDYSGGVIGNQFYLRNCGFFDDFTKLKTDLERPGAGDAKPVIDFKSLK